MRTVMRQGCPSQQRSTQKVLAFHSDVQVLISLLL